MLVSIFQLLKLFTLQTPLSQARPDGLQLRAAWSARTEEGDAFMSMGSFREISLSHEPPGMEAWKKSLPSPWPFQGRLFFRGVY